MGKYMRKAKLCGEVAVMEVPHQTPLGVRTRARTLALQRLLKPSSSPSSSPSQSPSPSPSPSLCPSSSPEYLELRSRRLEKPPPPPPRDACERRRGGGGGAGGGAKPAGPARRRVASAAAAEEEEAPDAGAEASSLGENAPEADSRDRNVRETTPCSLVRDSEKVSTPGSTTRNNSTAANRRVQSSVRRDIPTAHEMEEFFSAAERIQQQIFSERYNFDPVNERPLPGRYEWVKLGY